MPPLEPTPPISEPTRVGLIGPVRGHPSPRFTGLSLERLSVRQATYLGHRFGIDTPYLVVPLGWGEVSPDYFLDGDSGDPWIRTLAGPTHDG